MATNTVIYKEKSNGRYDGIYVISDGYLSQMSDIFTLSLQKATQLNELIQTAEKVYGRNVISGIDCVERYLKYNETKESFQEEIKKSQKYGQSTTKLKKSNTVMFLTRNEPLMMKEIMDVTEDNFLKLEFIYIMNKAGTVRARFALRSQKQDKQILVSVPVTKLQKLMASKVINEYGYLIGEYESMPFEKVVHKYFR